MNKMRKASVSQGGFTLIELLVVIGILAILLAITLIAINPNKHFQDTRNAKRSSDVAAILDAVYEYESAHNGSVPPSLASLTSTPAEICAQAGTPVAPCTGTVGVATIDLCANLAPTFLADLPMDPASAKGFAHGGSTPCAVGTTDYDTGYTIVSAAGGRFTVTAPNAEGATVSVTR